MRKEARMGAAVAEKQLRAEDLHGDPARWLPRVNRLLDEQWELCVGLDSLSARQSQAAVLGDGDGLLRILGPRQGLGDRVVEISAALEPFRAKKEELLGRLPPPQREGIVQRVGRITA